MPVSVPFRNPWAVKVSERISRTWHHLVCHATRPPVSRISERYVPGHLSCYYPIVYDKAVVETAVVDVADAAAAAAAGVRDHRMTNHP